MTEKLVIFGAGGHAKVVVDAIEMEGGYEIFFLADADIARKGTKYRGYEIRSEQEGLDARIAKVNHAFVAIGQNSVRKRIADAVAACGFVLATIVHPAAILSKNSGLGAGALLMPGSVVNADAKIGNGVIVNTGAVVEHDCLVGDFAHIGPNASLCGGVVIGKGALIGAGAVVLAGVRVGAEAIVGAGAVVLSDVPDSAKFVGVPAKLS